jgi:hypothetical protein
VAGPRTPDAATSRSAGGGEGSSMLRTLVPLVLFVALAVAAAFVIPTLLEDDPESVSRGGRGQGGALSPLEVASVTDFDPQGDGSEHPDEIGAAIDGDRTTTWSTESYSTPLEDQKEGVGLAFELQSAGTVEGIEISTTTPGFTFEIRAASEPGDALDDYDVVVSDTTADPTTSVDFDEPVETQHLLVWITSLGEGGSGSATLAEVTPYGS